MQAKGTRVSLLPVERMDVFRQTLDRIQRYIDEGGLVPGDRLPTDREFAVTLKVSRPIVRQALKVLEGLGRITVQHGVGAFVADNQHHVMAAELMRVLPVNRDLRRQLRVVRSSIEPAILAEALESDRGALVRDLRRVLGERREELRSGRHSTWDLRFEATIGRHCGNEILRRLQAAIHEAWLITQIADPREYGDLIMLHREHEEITGAIEMGDTEGAMRLLAMHLRRGTAAKHGSTAAPAQDGFPVSDTVSG